VSTQAVPHEVGVLDEQRTAHEGVAVQTADPLPLLGPGHGDPHTPPAPQPFCVPGV
jgi:hypothetical protein